MILNSQDLMSKAQQNKNLVEKLKRTGKYDEHKQKRAAKMKEYRAKKKDEELDESLATRANTIKERRAAVRERVRKHRELAKAKKSQENDTETNADQSIASQESTSLSDLTSVAYSNSQTLGKAVRKVKRAMSTSPTKQKAVLANIVSQMNED